MKPLFAILIPTTYDRQRLYDRVVDQLTKQIGNKECVIIPNLTKRWTEGGPTTGFKRNEGLDSARAINASHIAFVDSDDLVGPNYIERNMEAVYGNYDCAELWGQYYENNKQFNPFHHSIIHDHWHQDDRFYYRNPNHLNCIRLDHLKDIKFQDKTIGEDAHYSIDIQKTGRLKNEYPIKEIIYYYFSGKPEIKNYAMEPIWAEQRGIKL